MSTILSPPGPARGRPRPLRDRDGDARPAVPARTRLGAVAVPLAGAAGIAALVPARDLWPAQLALLALLLTVPGLALLRALGVPRAAVVATPVYVPAASIAVLLAAGVGVNFLGPLAGADPPLRTAPLLVGVEAVLLLLVLAGAARRPAPPAAAMWPGLRHLWPLALPLAAAVGAARLTSGEGELVAVAAVAAAVAVLVVAMIAGTRLDAAQLALVLFGVGLALAWSFSLRGGSVYGFDISGELPIVDAVRDSGVWRLDHPGDAYGAMLSLTVLPALLGGLTGVSSLVLLKAVYPVILALVPVTVFLIARRHLSDRYAFAGAAFVLVQANFAQQLPAVARQEIGLLLFAVLVAAVLDRAVPRLPRLGLVAALGLAMVVAHYSTAYLAIALFAIAIALQLAVSWFRSVPRVTGALAVALVVSAGGAALWYGPAMTDSAGNLTRFTDAVRTDGLRLLPNREPGQGLVQAYLTGTLPAEADAGEYGDLARRDYAATRPWVRPLPDAGADRYALRDAEVDTTPVRSDAAKSVLDRAQLWILQLANLLAIAGALALVLRRGTRPGLRIAAMLALAAVVALAVVRLSGTIADNYNQDRAFVQALVPLAVALAWVVQRGCRLAGRGGRAVDATAAVALGVVAACTSGLAGWALDRPSTNLGDRGEDYERYYVTRPELASADWLRTARPADGGVLYADRYGQLRLFSQGVPTASLHLDITPRTLDRDAWIYASAVNVVDGRARGRVGSRYATYRFPDRFIRDHWNTVYANGSSEVFNR
jgi:uncharacterized membrane protein